MKKSSIYKTTALNKLAEKLKIYIFLLKTLIYVFLLNLRNCQIAKTFTLYSSSILNILFSKCFLDSTYKLPAQKQFL